MANGGVLGVLSVIGDQLGRLERHIAPYYRPFVAAWGRVPVHIQGRVLVILPIVAVLISSGMVFVGNMQRARIESALERHLAFTREVNAVMTLMVNAETGMRGYLLTHRDTFLEPYVEARQALPDALDALRETVASEPGAGPRVRKMAAVERLGTLVDQQMADLDWQRAYVASGDAAGDEIARHLAIGKQLMDEIRADVVVMEGEEAALLLDRLQEINAIRARDYLAIYVSLVVALVTRVIAWFLFNRGVIRRVARIVEHLRLLRAGRPSSWEPSGKLDSIGLLEAEIGEAPPRRAPQATPLPAQLSAAPTALPMAMERGSRFDR